MSLAAAFSAHDVSFSAGGMRFTALAPCVDGALAQCGPARVQARGQGWHVEWPLASGGTRFVLDVEPLADGTGVRLDSALEGVAREAAVDAVGLSFGRIGNVQRYLRNGYTSWDGSYLVELEAARSLVVEDPRALTGHAMTALVAHGGGVAVLGFLRHDRYQSRLRFGFEQGPLALSCETLIDRVPHDGIVRAEPLVLLGGAEELESMLRRWARFVAAAAPQPPRLRTERVSGWCSWYNLYASISEPAILEHLRAAAEFRDRHHAPLEVFQIDDGFNPEMGDWLDVKPQFPRGMRALLADIRAAGFVPGLWIAPFMVGNRSRLYAEHPDWVVRGAASDEPLAPMKFYGEFRWHKRSEEYYVLDVTHPKAEAWLRGVLRTWASEWGCGYFKTDFMYFGSEYGPDRARWHRGGLSRMQVWMHMARLIRESIGEALWLLCGGPIWAPIGLVDAVRIGRDVGVSWKGHYSAESLLRDQTTRGFANGIFWQSDPDCVLLRARYHELTDEQVRSLARFAGLTGGVLMTSDHLGEVPAARRTLFAELAREREARPCEFPELGASALRHRIVTGHTGLPTLVAAGDPVLVQRVARSDGSVIVNLFNTGDTATERHVDWQLAGCGDEAVVRPLEPDREWVRTALGVHVVLAPHASCALLFSRRA